MTQINAYLTFNGNCREAMLFYQKCLGGKLTLQSVEESPMSDQWPKDVQKNILHASLINKQISLLSSDMGSEKLIMGNAISLALACSNEDEINHFFKNLSEQGNITHPLHRFFDGTIGALTDKYGINWLFKL
ncbi:VOC family protein [Aurantibacillus circumpalustris]|uniref:VOC family protein n=1 Tax=Aurantibacillus circumpalustris TaxID=3036359 RepID=UPI00295BC139|nr:VOC family protein [Aurantibacillus circumpalustris]